MSSSPLLPTISSSRLSSPILISKECLQKQLVLEEKLQGVGGELLELYKKTKQWNQVRQLAQTLRSNSDRIASLCFSIDGSIITFPMDSEASLYSVTATYEEDDPHWILQLSSNQPVRRSLEDINNIKTYLSIKHNLSLAEKDGPSLQEFLSLAMRDEVVKLDHFLVCFLSSEVEDFSLLFNVSERLDEVTCTNGHLIEDGEEPSQEVSTGKLENSPKVEPSQEDETSPGVSTGKLENPPNVEPSQKDETSPGVSTGKLENSPKVEPSQEDETSPGVSTGKLENSPKVEPSQEDDTSSGVSIDELDSSPKVPKRLTSPQSPSVESTTPVHSTTPLTIDHMNSVISKPESSSDEVCSAIDEVTSESDVTSQKPRSQSVFYDPSSPSPPSSSTSKSVKKKISKKNKIKEDSTVSPLSPQFTVDWDPTCLLEELYNDCQPGVGHSTSGENSRYSGYLEKLPVNQRKPTVMKGWKRRFFRLTRGSLFYYDGENSTKATSFIRLSDSKIVQHPESLKVEIIEKGGNFIMLRAESKEDLTTWSRVLQLEAVHPTMTHRLSLSPGRSVPVLIIDLGACSVRAGMKHDNTYPQLFFPTVCAVNDEKIISCGNEALLPGTRSLGKLIYPCRRRVRLDASVPVRKCFQCIIEKICKTLRVEPQDSCALVCISPVMPESEQICLCEVLLEVLNFRSVLIQEQTTMALYSYNHTSGIVVNIGDSTDVVPIIDGFKVDAGSSHTPFGGHSITENLSRLATSKGIRYFSEAEMYIVRYMKESICFSSQDYPEDCSQCEESPAEYIRAVDVDRFQLSDHRKVIHLDSALFKSPEGLFSPGIWGIDAPGIHEIIQKAIEQCPIDMRRQMVRHIYLAGGTTLLIGLQERLQKELEIMFPRMDIQIHGSENRQHAAFLGAGVLASLNSFTKSLVDLEAWNAKGLDAMRQRGDT